MLTLTVNGVKSKVTFNAEVNLATPNRSGGRGKTHKQKLALIEGMVAAFNAVVSFGDHGPSRPMCKLSAARIRAELPERPESLPPGDYAKGGYVGDSQMATLSLLMHVVMASRDDKKILWAAPPQWGKAIVMACFKLVFPVFYYLKTGRHCVIVMSEPADKTIVNQTKGRVKEIYAVLEGVTLRCNRRELSVKEYWVCHHPGSGSSPCCDDMMGIYLRSTRGQRLALAYMAEECERNLIDVFYIEDECDHGSGHDGVADRLNKALPPGCNIMMCSATPSEQVGIMLSRCARVPSYVEKGYRGPCTVYGVPMIKMPGYEYDPATIQSDLERYKFVVNSLEAQYDALRIECARLENQGGGGVLTRVHKNTNVNARRLAAMLTAGGVAVLLYFGGVEDDMQACRDRMQLPPGKAYVCIVSGRARRGNTIPHDVYIGLDPTRNTWNADAAIQGFLGRFMVYSRVRAVVVLSEGNAERARHWSEAGYDLLAILQAKASGSNRSMRLSNRADSTIVAGDGAVPLGLKPPTYYTIFADELPRNNRIKRALAAFEPHLKLGPTGWGEKGCDILSDALIAEIERGVPDGAGYTLARYGQDDGRGKKLGKYVERRTVNSREHHKYTLRAGGGHGLRTDPTEARNRLLVRFKGGQQCPECGRPIDAGVESTTRKGGVRDCCKRAARVAEREVFGLDCRTVADDEAFRAARERAASQAQARVTPNHRSRHRHEAETYDD